VKSALGDIGNLGERIGEPGQWIDVVELGGANQRVHEGGAFSAPVGADEQPRLSPCGFLDDRALYS
jgi:hypothetical protein